MQGLATQRGNLAPVVGPQPANTHTRAWGLTTLTMTLRRVLSQVPQPGAERKNSSAGCRLQVLDQGFGSELAALPATPWCHRRFRKTLGENLGTD